MRLTGGGGAGLSSLSGFQSGETFENSEKIISVSMERPHFPSLQPKMADQQWFHIDKPCDEESELTQLEKEHQNALTSISQKHSDLIPIGKTAAEDEDEEDDDDDDNDDDESDSNEDEDDELDADDMNYDQDSPMFH
ncbi:anaphase-promoting complex subunit 15B isoform X4 [Ixodes scapularis]|nr:anaphase-promoting complex subunit 15B isoform X4 [Ixodes scapularis]